MRAAAGGRRPARRRAGRVEPVARRPAGKVEPVARRPAGKVEPAARFDAAADAVQQVLVLVRAGVRIDDIPAFLGPEARGVLSGGGLGTAGGAAGPGGAAESGGAVSPGGAAILGGADVAAVTAGTTRAAGVSEHEVVGAVLRVCRIAGAPLAPALERQVEVFRTIAQGSREADLAAAGPQATARIVALLPLAGMVVAGLLGFDVVGALFGSVLGCAAGVVGVVLALLGRGWARRMIARARPVLVEPGMLHELVAVGLAGGLPVEAAIGLAVEAAGGPAETPAWSRPRSGRSEVHTESRPGDVRPGAHPGSQPPGAPSEGHPDGRAVASPGRRVRRRAARAETAEALPDAAAEAVDDIRRVIAVAQSSGAEVRPLLRANADVRRRRRAAADRRRIERLATDLLAPLGLCSLPAFLLLGVVPALLAVVSSTVSAGR